MTDTVDVGPVTPLNREQRRAAEKRYNPGRKVLILDFTGTPHEGLEARCRSMRFGQMMDLARGDMMDLVREVKAGRVETLTDEQIEQMDVLFQLFADALISWNLDEDVEDSETGELTGEVRPVPPTLDGLWSQDPPLVMTVFEVWTKAMATVPAPLPVPSSSGAPSPVGSLPMVPKSPNPQSS